MTQANPYPDDDGDPTAEELADLERWEAETAEKIRVMLDADPELATLVEEWRQAQALADKLQFHLHGLVNQKGDLVRSIKHWRKQAKK